MPRFVCSLCWLFEPQVADDGRQAREHGCGDVLPELGPAIIPQQASAAVLL
jgi:hypothetical protein